ncbi:MAG: glycosyltransferase family 1 protein [Phocaeicola sp.]
MTILFLVYHGFSEISGISKKIQYQIKGLRESNHTVDVCTYTINNHQHRVRLINDNVIQDYGIGPIAAIRKRFDYSQLIRYVISHSYDIIYVRSFHNANPFTVHLFKKLKESGSRIAMEIPTYPYDQEYQGYSLRNRLGLMIDKLFRYQLARYTDLLVTFTNDTMIFGQKALCISNGIDFDSIPLQEKHPSALHEIHLTGVAEVHYWHGFDRVIEGLGRYYRGSPEVQVYFHIIGGIAPSEMYNSKHAKGFKDLIEEYQLETKIIFHGALFGTQLEKALNRTDFAIGSLGRHRSGITHIKTLKNREYAARGIPFIFSESDSDFDDKPYILKASADETPIEIEAILSFIKLNTYSSFDIRKSILHLSWKEQMKIVVDGLTPSPF